MITRSVVTSIRISLQPSMAFPVYPALQVQMGLCWFTLHLASRPQVPGQGSPQRFLMQARFRAQSELTSHSGRQLGGALM
jgi:hypothetical protein